MNLCRLVQQVAQLAAGGRRGQPEDLPGSGDKEAKAKLCRIETGEAAVAFGPPA
jgi:hypothetical protein